MAQFDVYLLSDGSYVVDVQSDYVDTYGTRLVVPLIERDDDAGPVSRLNPALPIDGSDMLLATQLASAVRKNILRTPIASLDDHDFTIKSALDMLISGF